MNFFSQPKESFSQLVSKFNSLNDWQQKTTLFACGVGSVALISFILHVKKRRKFNNDINKLHNQGYRDANGFDCIMEAYSKHNKALTISAFETCSDSFSYETCVQFWANVAIEYITFRSVLQYQNHLNTYFWIECNRNKNNNVNTRFDQDIENNNIQLTNNLTRSQFFNLYGFDIVKQIQLRILFYFISFYFVCVQGCDIYCVGFGFFYCNHNNNIIWLISGVDTLKWVNCQNNIQPR